jgi:hypothetical protein
LILNLTKQQAVINRLVEWFMSFVRGLNTISLQ